MKKVWAICMFLGLAASLWATPDISFSSGEGSFWRYNPLSLTGEGAFSFDQPVNINSVLGATADTLTDAFLYLPELYISDLTQIAPGVDIYTGTVAPLSPIITIRDAAGNDLLTGTLGEGVIFTIGTTAALYTNFEIDATITTVTNPINSDFLDTLTAGDVFDFDLSLQGTNIAQMILNNTSVSPGSSFSGSMTRIPEPATMAMLGIGMLLLPLRRR